MPVIFNAGYTCPFPGCNHVGGYITNNHCVQAHGIEKTELLAKYGRPPDVQIKPGAVKDNMTGYAETGNVNRGYFSTSVKAKERRQQRRDW